MFSWSSGGGFEVWKATCWIGSGPLLLICQSCRFSQVRPVTTKYAFELIESQDYRPDTLELRFRVINYTCRRSQVTKWHKALCGLRCSCSAPFTMATLGGTGKNK
uniref:Secreted protein n=1 Tax=Heterorhabditis bacteriophora TaxID=37862 RepID=A0A1I7WLU4_HETBA